jgi:UPF0271 protein
MSLSINCDMGEAFGLYVMGDDEAIIRHVTWANVACGFHASDPSVMHATVRLAKQHGVRVGAHPSLPDLQGFGRREMKIERGELTDCLIYQVGALKAFLDAERHPLHHLKPHGALYGMASRTPEIADAICDVAALFGVPVLGLAGSEQERQCARRGIPFVAEFYVDLEYDDDGRLVITRKHHAVEPGAAAKRALRALDEGVVRGTGGRDVPVRAESLCVHSDTPGALEVAKAVHAAVADRLA